MFYFYTARGKDEYASTSSGITTTNYEKGTGVYAELGGGYFSFIDKSHSWILKLMQVEARALLTMITEALKVLR